MPDSQILTLRELIELALPSETRVIAQPTWLERPVTWSVAVSANDWARVDTGDLVLLLPPYPNDWAWQLPRLAHIGIAGIAIVGEAPFALEQTARQVQVPLLALPAGMSLRALERAVLTCILDRDTAVAQRVTRLYHQLTLLSAENAGLDAMAAFIGRALNKTVLIQDKRLNIIAAWLAPEDVELRARLETWATTPANVPEELRDRKRAAQNHPVLEQLLAKENRARLIAPIVAKGMARGFLSLLALVGAFQQMDWQMAEQGAAACALEMAKAKAVSEAEKRVRGGFIEALLAGNLSPEEAVRWAKRDQYNPEGTHTVIVIAWAKASHPSYRRLETIVHGITRADTLVHARSDEIIIFARLDTRQGIERARGLAHQIRRYANAEYPNDPLAIGLGRAVETLIELRDAYREARQAMSMAQRLGESQPLYFGELKVYRLLFLLEHHPELATFCQDIIGSLIEYDRAQGTDLLDTLTAYFAHKGNISQTAEALFIHRNTLLYRMERIREISGLDLDNPETRLSLELALRAHRLLLAREERR